jgi:D-apionolactonase
VSATAESRLQTAVRCLNFGPWSADLQGDELAHIRHRGFPVLRGLRAVIRNHNWLTLRPVLSASHVQESAGSLRLVLDVAWKGYSARYAGRVTLLFEAESITVLFQGRAVEDIACNRVGLVVLHRPDDAGRPVTVTSPGGSTADAAFPAHISPHQPFKNIMALDWERDGVAYRLDFEGDVFETEDQRNWTDASFKTYSTPLSEPFPVTHRAGDTVRQSIRLSARQIIRINDEKTAAVPALGTSAGGTATPAPSPSSPLPAEFAPLLAEIALESDPGRGVISAAEAARLSAALKLDLDARIIAATPEDALAILRELPLDRVERLAAYDSTTHVTQKNLWDAVTTGAKELGFQGHLVAGARSHFTELNRNRHSACPDAAAVTYSITPQMHATEPEAIVETLAMQALTAEDALRISNGRALHIGPVTLARRFNAAATEPPGQKNSPRTTCSKTPPSPPPGSWAASQPSPASRLPLSVTPPPPSSRPRQESCCGSSPYTAEVMSWQLIPSPQLLPSTRCELLREHSRISPTSPATPSRSASSGLPAPAGSWPLRRGKPAPHF